MKEHPIRESTRLRGYDYATVGMYFITICLQHREPRFGSVEGGEMQLNAAGEMVASMWQENAKRYSQAALDTFLVMPDHFHAIVFIGTSPDCPDAAPSLTRVVQSFKSFTTVEYARGVRDGLNPQFDRVLWQRGFYDRILRGQRELEITRAYIEANPARVQAKQNNEG